MARRYFRTIVLLCLFLCAACGNSPQVGGATPPPARPTSTRVQGAPTPAPTVAPTPTAEPTSYTARVLLKNAGRPDDMLFDRQGRILFSDFYNGTVSRINGDGSVSVLLRNIAGPEGLVLLASGTLIIAEQRTNRVLQLAPGSTTPTLLRALPGQPSAQNCKDGVDGIALDPTTSTLIVPDSPTGDVYRMSLDGKQLTRLVGGITRPVGAAVARDGTIYVADECGGSLWRIAPGGASTKITGFGMLDDIAIDASGSLLLTDLLPSLHALLRYQPATGKRETLARAGFIEPQGLLVDSHGTIYVSDDYSDVIMKYTPAGAKP